MSKLSEFFAAQKRLLRQDREISRLRAEVAQLQSLNSSMREGMRRCVSCEYRIDFKNRQGQPSAGDTNQDSPP